MTTPIRGYKLIEKLKAIARGCDHKDPLDAVVWWCGWLLCSDGDGYTTKEIVSMLVGGVDPLSYQSMAEELEFAMDEYLMTEIDLIEDFCKFHEFIRRPT